MPPLFSIILPTYDRAAMLRTAIRSVLGQKFASFECFVVDDGSTDDTPQVFAEFAGAPRLRLQRFPDNRRQHVRRNWALGQAQGEFITFLDSDDIWLPRRLEAFAAAIHSRPGTDIWFSNAWLWREGRVLGTLFGPAQPLAEGRLPGWFAVGRPEFPYLTTNLAIRRSVFERVGRFREDMAILEDTELYARMLRAGSVVGGIGSPLSVRRLHEGQLTHDYRVDFQEGLMALEAGGAPEDVLRTEKERLAMAAAGYLLRALRPREAREFLTAQLGVPARRTRLYRLTFLPAGWLALAKTLRRLYLLARWHPAWAAPAVREVYGVIASLSAKSWPLSAENLSS